MIIQTQSNANISFVSMYAITTADEDKYRCTAATVTKQVDYPASAHIETKAV